MWLKGATVLRGRAHHYGMGEQLLLFLFHLCMWVKSNEQNTAPH